MNRRSPLSGWLFLGVLVTVWPVRAHARGDDGDDELVDESDGGDDEVVDEESDGGDDETAFDEFDDRAIQDVSETGATADAAEPDDQRFYLFKPSFDKDETDFVGTITSSSFFYGEYASGDDPVIQTDPTGLRLAAEVDSPRSRYFTDLRARFDARHIKGGYWSARFDGRIRLVPSDKIQSGQFPGNEYDLRELFFGRDGNRTDIYLGRQYALELAAVKFDGARFDYEKSARWHVLGFAGAYPTRGSRSIDDDYPHAEGELGLVQDKRVIPATAGLGAAYREENVYGSFGVVGIVPFTHDQATGERETQRIFVTSQGYWRQSQSLDIYHYFVGDLTGADGAALTNLSLGATYSPSFSLHITGQYSHVDTETLDVQAQTRLLDPDTTATANVVLNNVAVTRISQDEVNLGVSGSFRDRRFELSAEGTLRRRPDVTVTFDDGTETVLSAAQAADVQLTATDRRSFKDMRLSLSYLRAFGVGDQNLNRSNFQLVFLDAQRDFAAGKGSFEGSLTYLRSEDDPNGEGMTCSALDPLSCYGTSKANTFTLGVMGTYRIERDWLGILSTNFGLQSLNVQGFDDMGNLKRVDLPNIFTASVFLRIARRF